MDSTDRARLTAEAADARDWARLTAEAADARDAEAASLLLTAVGEQAPEEVTTMTTFPIPATLVPVRHTDDAKVIATQVRVWVTRYNGGANEDDGAGYIRVEMYAQEAKADGTPHSGRRTIWTPAPQSLAAPLLLAALSRSTIATKEG